MRKYAKVSPLFWLQGSGKRLRGDAEAQALAMHLLTGPSSNMIGLYYLPLPTVAHELGWLLNTVTDALRRVCSSGLAAYDTLRELVWVFNAAEFEFGDAERLGPKLGRGIANQLTPFGSHHFVLDFLHRYGARYGIQISGLQATPLNPNQLSLFEGVSGFGHQGQDQGQDQKQGQGQDSGMIPPPVRIETVLDAKASQVATPNAVELFEHYQIEHGRVHGSSKVLVPPSAGIDAARRVLALAGSDMELAKVVVTRYVESQHSYWRERNWPLWLLAKPNDFEQARLSGEKKYNVGW